MTYSTPGRSINDDTSTEPEQHPVRRAVNGVAPVSTSMSAGADAGASKPHARIKPLKLPSVSKDAARLARTLCDTRLAAYLQVLFDVDAAAFSASVIDRDADPAKFADPAVLEISLGSRVADHVPRVSHLRIAVDLRAYPSLAIAASPEHDPHVAPATIPSSAPTSAGLALRQAVASVLLEPLLAGLTRAGLRDPYITSLRRGHLNAASLAALSLTLNGHRHNVLVATDTEALDQLDAATSDHFAARGSSRAAAATCAIPGSLIVGVKALSIETLESLNVGDVLLRALFPTWNTAWLVAASMVGTSSVAARPRAIATWGTPGLTRLCAVVELHGHSPVIVKEPNMSEELDPGVLDADFVLDQADTPIELGELELPVQFEIDTVAMPLAQLASLGPGYVVELPVSAADAQLRLVAHGQTIGYGELVTVGEHLGIRITRMAHRHGTLQ